MADVDASWWRRPRRAGLDRADARGLQPGDGREEQHLSAHGVPRIDATGASLHRCALELTGLEELVGDRARLVECEVVTPQLSSCAARGGAWRSVVVTAGRIGALEAPAARWDAVALLGTRVGYLSLRDAHVTDTVLEGCHLDTLDLTAATLTRVRIRDCVVDELVLTRARLAEVDLRGTQLTRVEGVLGLAGAAITDEQLLVLAPLLAHACGLRVLPEPTGSRVPGPGSAGAWVGE